MAQTSVEEQYLSILETLVRKFEAKGSNPDRTGVGTVPLFGVVLIADVSEDFPLLVTKRVHFKSVVTELIWFLSGDTNIKYLVDNNNSIWNKNAYDFFRKGTYFNGETIKEYIGLIKSDREYANSFGNLGPVYGYQWRHGFGMDQLEIAIKKLADETQRHSRRNIVSAWDPSKLDEMALPPCHLLYQFHYDDGKAHLSLYQRSADWFLGVPFNIASYALLLKVIAKRANLKPGTVNYHFGDAHLYRNHIGPAKEQLKRLSKIEEHKSPKVTVKGKINIDNIDINQIDLVHYTSERTIKAEMAV